MPPTYYVEDYEELTGRERGTEAPPAVMSTQPAQVEAKVVEPTKKAPAKKTARAQTKG